MREIVLDTETTGLDPKDGHRLVEIACLELNNHIPTGRHYQVYLNPERDMPPEAAAVHGLTGEFLADKPRFAEAVEQFLEFIGDAPLVIHNAEFDMRFLNAELARAGRPALDFLRATDTLLLARQKFPEELRFEDEFPRTSSGKIQKFVLRQKVRDEAATKE